MARQIFKGGAPFTKPYHQYPHNVLIPIQGAVSPTNAVTGAGVAGIGSIYIDYVLGTLWINTGTKASPTWTQLVATGSIGASTGTSLTVTGVLRSTGSTSGVGYSAGAGGAVTQITDSTTGVTLSKVCGQITTVALTTAAGAEERFTVTNTNVVATDCIALGTTYNGNGTAAVSVCKVAANAFDIVITNLHASAALNAAVVINFAIVKAVAA